MTFPAPIRRQSGRIDVRVPMAGEEEAKKPIAHVPDVHQSILEGWFDGVTTQSAKKERVLVWDGNRMWQNCKYSYKKGEWQNAEGKAIKVFMWKKEG